MLDLGSKGCLVETPRRHYGVFLNKALASLSSVQPRKKGKCPDMTEFFLTGT